MSNEAKRVLAGFLVAEYGIEGVPARILTIGETIASSTTLAWITAFNPLGEPRGEVENHTEQQRLCAQLRSAGMDVVSGFARSSEAVDGHSWFEPCAVVSDPALALIDALAQEHRQLAVVVASVTGGVRLRCYQSIWRQRFGTARTDAAGVDCGAVDWIA